jgi:hypothetical protein
MRGSRVIVSALVLVMIFLVISCGVDYESKRPNAWIGETIEIYFFDISDIPCVLARDDRSGRVALALSCGWEGYR